ncbi:MAG: low-specificity L-threonine aldolase [Acidobacteria bacterium]|nr:low-specificity L-threonine aldolase [Acidobacteriota bacterium]
MKEIDLRSDTVTLPTPAMREAMYRAEVGDDVFEEDPTVKRLEEMAAARIGKEAALLVSSGTMANLTCTLTHCARGEEAVLGDQSHIFLNEAGGMSALGGIHPHLVPNQPDGTIKPHDLESAIRGDNVHFPRTRLICLENTHNRCDGSALTPDYCDAVAELARKHGLKVHIDGARIFNAAAALGIDAKDLARCADSVSFCLSKGLSAPVGSLVCGTREFVAEARRNRKLLGGGMRQAGIIAAAGIEALERMIDRLPEDHCNARRLAEGIDRIEGLAIDLSRIQTNIVYFRVASDRITGEQLLKRLGEKGVKTLLTGPNTFRMVTHYGIGETDIDSALAAIREVMEQTAA